MLLLGEHIVFNIVLASENHISCVQEVGYTKMAGVIVLVEYVNGLFHSVKSRNAESTGGYIKKAITVYKNNLALHKANHFSTSEKVISNTQIGCQIVNLRGQLATVKWHLQFVITI